MQKKTSFFLHFTRLLDKKLTLGKINVFILPHLIVFFVTLHPK